MGEGEKYAGGGPSPPPDPRVAAARPLPIRNLPLSARARGEGAGGMRAAPVSPAARCGCHFRTETYPCQPSPWERELGVRVVPSGPAARCGCHFRSDTSPVNPCEGRGEESASGEGLALPRTPGLPLRGRFPMNPCPCQPWRWERGLGGEGGSSDPGRERRPPLPNGCLPLSALARGEGEKLTRGEPNSPRTPGLPLGGRFRTESSPGQMAMGDEEESIWGRAKPSLAPPGCRGAAASETRPPLVGRGRR